MNHVTVMSLTASVGLMAIFIVDFVDMIFISMLGDSSLAAAIGYAGTILFITSSISIGMSIAAGVMVARALGKDDAELAARSATNVATVGVALALLVIVAVFVFMEPILSSIGATGESLTLAKTYLTILVPTMPIMMVAMIANGLLRAHGDAKRAMYATLAGGIVNAALDPIFIFVLDMNLAGAAWASVASRIAMLVFSIAPMIKIYSGFARPSLSSTHAQFRDIYALASPSVLANIASPIGASFVTKEMAKFGDDAVAGAAIIGRLTPVAFSVVFALSGAIGPIIGQNAGAGLSKRVKAAYWDAVKFTIYYVAAVSLLLFLLRAPIADLFDASGQKRDLIYLFCGPIALSYIFVGIIFVTNASFNNLNHPYYSTWINWGRNTLGTIIPIWICAHFWGAPGILIGQALGSLIFAIIAQALVSRIMSQTTVNVSHKPFTQHLRDHIMHMRNR